MAIQKTSVRAIEQEREDVAEARAVWTECQSDVDADSLVFLDETGLKTDMARLRGWGIGGERVVDHTPSARWHTSTLVSAISTAGVLTALVVDGAINGDWFTVFCEQQLAPVLEPGQTVVLDNLGSHHVKAAATAIEAVGCHLAFLPPYSPDLNPIEHIFSKLKSAVRRLRPRCWDEIVDAARVGLLSITPSDCINSIEHCGYAVVVSCSRPRSRKVTRLAMAC